MHVSLTLDTSHGYGLSPVVHPSHTHPLVLGWGMSFSRSARPPCGRHLGLQAHKIVVDPASGVAAYGRGSCDGPHRR